MQVTIAASTLTGQDDVPAELDGHGLLHPDIARTLASAATGWNRLFTSPDGMITTVDRYRPTKQMRRYLRARDQRCRFPGCHTPAARCEIDHTHDYAKGGPTALTNLENLCPSHHALKHPDLNDEIRWTARQRPNGDLTWTSPTGREYTDHAPRRVVFT